MSRFLKNTDYKVLIRQEIKKLLDGSLPGDDENSPPPTKLLQAESAAIQQIRNWLSNAYDCDTIFSASNDPDERDQFIVVITIDITLYHLYSQTGHKDVPEHRSQRYQDALDWLKAAGKGEIGADLPTLPSEDNPGEIRISSNPPENHTW